MKIEKETPSLPSFLTTTKQGSMTPKLQQSLFNHEDFDLLFSMSPYEALFGKDSYPPMMPGSSNLSNGTLSASHKPEQTMIK